MSTSMYYYDSAAPVEPDTNNGRPILEWSTDDVCSWLSGIKDALLDTNLITELFRKHNISGQSLEYLTTELLLEVGISDLKTRLLLKKHIDQLLLQNSLINKELDEELKINSNSLITTIALLESVTNNLKLQNNNDYTKLKDQFGRLREDLLPVFKWIKDHKPLPTPEITKFSNTYLNSVPNSASSPTKTSSRTSQTTSPILLEHQTLNSPLVAQFPLNSSSSSNNLRSMSTSRRKSILSPSEHNNTNLSPQSPTKSSSTLLPTTTLPMTTPSSSTTTLRPQLAHTTSQQSLTRPQLTSSGSSEPLKQLRAKTDDPCYKILQHAMRRHGISNDDWRKYALVICYGDQERVLELNEKPVVIFRELQEEGQHPAIMLRQIDYNDDDETINTTPGGRI